MTKPIIKCKERSLRIEMVKRGLNIRMLAEEAELNQSYLSLIINGHKNIGVKSARIIMDVLHCEFDDIFTIEADMPIEKEVCN